MSYVRGPDSDVYLIGITASGLGVIQCCGCTMCRLTKQEPADVMERFPDPAHWSRGLVWVADPYPVFAAKDEAIAHLDDHRELGDQVPDRAYDAIRNDNDWIGRPA
jgi:hypothetical protein